MVFLRSPGKSSFAASPKSPSLTSMLASRKMLPSFRSRWMICCLCRCDTPYKTIGPYFLDQTLYEFNITIFPYYYFYPIYWLGTNSVKMDIETQKKRYPTSYMTQYGYTTNNIDIYLGVLTINNIILILFINTRIRSVIRIKIEAKKNTQYINKSGSISHGST